MVCAHHNYWHETLVPMWETLLIGNPYLLFGTLSKAEARLAMIAPHNLSWLPNFLFFFSSTIMCLHWSTNDFSVEINICEVSDHSLISSAVFAFHHIILNSAKDLQLSKMVDWLIFRHARIGNLICKGFSKTATNKQTKKARLCELNLTHASTSHLTPKL